MNNELNYTVFTIAVIDAGYIPYYSLKFRGLNISRFYQILSKTNFRR